MAEFVSLEEKVLQMTTTTTTIAVVAMTVVTRNNRFGRGRHLERQLCRGGGWLRFSPCLPLYSMDIRIVYFIVFHNCFSFWLRTDFTPFGDNRIVAGNSYQNWLLDFQNENYDFLSIVVTSK
jgi:hypothetical protein